MDTVLIIFIVLFFTFGVPLVFVTVFLLKVHKPLEEARIKSPQEVIVREVVMVPCVYCGGLMPTTSTYCPHCQAPRKT